MDGLHVQNDALYYYKIPVAKNIGSVDVCAVAKFLRGYRLY